MRKKLHFLVGLACLACLAGLTSCSEESDEWNPYYDWESRNVQWFAQVADTARTAINKAKAQYGNNWEEHCEWRMFKSLQRSADVQGPVTDSVVCKIVKKGTGTHLANYTDYVLLHYRGWLMPSEYVTENRDTKESKMAVFSQTYYGDFNPETASPMSMPVSAGIEGFQTALQYMVEGDEWYVYIPYQMAYGSESPDTSIPSYSALLYLVNLVGIYENEDDVPDWD